MTLEGQRAQSYAEDLARRLRRDWRVRCALRRARWELTSGQAAADLCGAVVATVLEGRAGPELARSARCWGSRVASPTEARAALQCLGEAVGALVASEFGDFRPKGLDPTLEQLALESLLPAGRRTTPVCIDPLTGCPDRASLAGDLAVAVTDAAARGEDLTLAVLALDDGGPTSDRHRTRRVHGPRLGDRRPDATDDGQVLGLLATVRHVFGGRVCVYRIGADALALLARRTGAVAMGEAILQATCLVGPRFTWGTADLRSVGDQAVSSPDALLVLAEADMVLRQRDYVRATESLSSRRRLSVAGSIAAAMLLLAGIGVVVLGSPGSRPPARTALPGLHGTPPSPAPSGPVPTTVPAPAPAQAAPPGSGSPVPSGAMALAISPLPPPVPSAVLTSYQAPAQSPAPSPPAPSPPAPSPPAPSPPPPSPAPPPSAGPGQGHGASGSHAHGGGGSTSGGGAGGGHLATSSSSGTGGTKTPTGQA
jgi:GGDEF domain-containing protein